MIYHDLDFFILKSLLESNEQITTWKLAKQYCWDNKPNFSKPRERDDYFRNKSRILMSRLRCMEKAGLIIILENGNKKDYSIIKENVQIKRIKFPNNKIGKAMFIKETGNKWQVFEI